MDAYYIEKAIDKTSLSSSVFVTEFYMPKCVCVLIGILGNILFDMVNVRAFPLILGSLFLFSFFF